VTFAFTDEQLELRSSASRFLDDKSTSEAVRALAETELGFDEATWKQIAELGWVGIAIPEAYGGLGFGFVELGLLCEEMGKRLACLPYFSSVVLGANAILNAGAEDQRQTLLPGIADGTTRVALAFVEDGGRWEPEAARAASRPDGDAWRLDGEKLYVIDGHSANLLVVSAATPDGVALFTVDPDDDGVSREPMTTLDTTRKQARITLDGAHATLLGEAGAGAAALSRTLDQGAAALSAEMVGGAQWCLDASASYARERYQFGRPIGSFQAIKHKLADMLIEVENARSVAYYGCWAAAEDPGELPVASCMAKAFCSDAFFHAASEAIQIHGGIGFTWEHDCHLFFRRAKSSEIYLGDATHHRGMLADRLEV
jgi:alkylation response protein AidB-like acyl-CoA dehydrogenase